MRRRSTSALIVFVAILAAIVWWFVAAAGQRGSRNTLLAAPDPTEVSAQAAPVDRLASDAERTPVAAEGAAAPAAPIPSGPPSGSIRLFGSVLESTGEPLARPESALALTSSAGARSVAKIEKGEYAFDGLEPGQYALQSRMPGYRHVDLTVRLRADEPFHRQDIRVERAWTILVHMLTPDGEDLRTRLREMGPDMFMQPTILATLASPGDHLEPNLLTNRSNDGVSLMDTATQDPFQDAPKGGYPIYMQSEPPVYVSVLLRDRVLATQRVDQRVDDLTFTIDPDRVRELLAGLVVRVVDAETGQPATESWTSLSTSQSMEGGVHPDADGVVRCTDRIPGFYDVLVRMKGRALETRRVELLPGQVTDLGTISLGTGIAIAGRCVDEEGHPHKIDASLIAIADGSSPERYDKALGHMLKTDDQGQFALKSLRAGRYVTRIPAGLPRNLQEGESGWAAEPVLIDTREGPVTDLVLVVRRPVEVVLRPASRDVAGLEFRVLTASGIGCCEGSLDGTATTRLELVRGSYTLRLTREHAALREVPLTVGSDPQTIEVMP